MKVGVLDMISLEDCIGLCGLDESEVLAIAEHEHIPEIAAAALASYLSKQPHGGEVQLTARSVQVLSVVTAAPGTEVARHSIEQSALQPDRAPRPTRPESGTGG